MSACGLSNMHIMTKTGRYYVDTILEKEVKPLLNRKTATNETITNKMVVNKRKFTFQQDGAPAHRSSGAQDWCQRHLPNWIGKDEWPGNSPDLNPTENLFSILDDKVYADPQPQTLETLSKRLKLSWKSIPSDTLRNLIHSMPQRLKAVIYNNGGHSGY